MDLRVEKNTTTIVIVLLALIAAAMLSYGAFSYYRSSLSEKAHEAFMRHYASFEKISSENGKPSQELLAVVAQDYAQYKRSSFGSFFLALQAEMQQLTGNKQEALESMDKAIQGMSTADPVLYYVYATKHALMQIDATDPSVQTRGRKALEKLANTIKNPMRDMAIFYMGYQAFLEQDNAGVHTAWSKLFDAQGNPASAWGMRAQALRNYTA